MPLDSSRHPYSSSVEAWHEAVAAVTQRGHKGLLPLPSPMEHGLPVLGLFYGEGKVKTSCSTCSIKLQRRSAQT